MACRPAALKLFIPLFIMQPQKRWQCVQDSDPDHPERFDLTPYLDAFTYPLMTLYAMLPAIGQAVSSKATAPIPRPPLAKQYQDDEPAPVDYIIGAGHAMDLPFVFGTFSNDAGNLTRFAWNEANREGRTSRMPSDLPLWTPWSSECGQPKHMTFNNGRIAMSSAYIEPDEVCITCEAQDLLNIISDLIKGSTDSQQKILGVPQDTCPETIESFLERAWGNLFYQKRFPQGSLQQRAGDEAPAGGRPSA